MHNVRVDLGGTPLPHAPKSLRESHQHGRLLADHPTHPAVYKNTDRNLLG